MGSKANTSRYAVNVTEKLRKRKPDYRQETNNDKIKKSKCAGNIN